MSDELPDDAEAAVFAAMTMREQRKVPLDFEAVVHDPSEWLLVKTLGSISAAAAVDVVKKAVQAWRKEVRSSAFSWANR